MYVCMCKRLTDGDIRQSVFRGHVGCMDTLRENLGASTGCGSCAAVAQECLSEALEEKRRVEQTCRDHPVGSAASPPQCAEPAVSPGFPLAAPRLSYG